MNPINIIIIMFLIKFVRHNNTGIITGVSDQDGCFVTIPYELNLLPRFQVSRIHPRCIIGDTQEFYDFQGIVYDYCFDPKRKRVFLYLGKNVIFSLEGGEVIPFYESEDIDSCDINSGSQIAVNTQGQLWVFLNRKRVMALLDSNGAVLEIVLLPEAVYSKWKSYGDSELPVYRTFFSISARDHLYISLSNRGVITLYKFDTEQWVELGRKDNGYSFAYVSFKWTVIDDKNVWWATNEQLLCWNLLTGYERVISTGEEQIFSHVVADSNGKIFALNEISIFQIERMIWSPGNHHQYNKRVRRHIKLLFMVLRIHYPLDIASIIIDMVVDESLVWL